MSVWSGARDPPAPGGWFDGQGFWLNEVAGEEVGEDDERLFPEERADFEAQADDAGDNIQYVEMSIDDERCIIPRSANSGALRLGSLNHDPAGLRSALLTSFDLIEDVAWLKGELMLPGSVPLTFCMHPWPNKWQERSNMISDLLHSFENCIFHFPGGLANCGCSVHAKLILLEFDDRLRVVLSSANLKPVHWKFRNEAVWVQDFPRHPAQQQPDLSRFFGEGLDFGRVLGHFVAELLEGSKCERQRCWTETLAAFDFSGAAARLLPSCPGLAAHVARRAGSLSLRLRATPAEGVAPVKSTGKQETSDQPPPSPPPPAFPSRALLVPMRRGAWEVRRLDDGGASDGGASGSASEAGREAASSVTAMPAAWMPGLIWRSILSWISTLHRRPANILGVLRPHSCEALAAAQGFGLRIPQIVEVEVVEEVDEYGQPCLTILVRAALEGPSPSGWDPRAGALLAHLEENYGFYALREHLSQEVWRQEEERHYVSISSAVESSDEAWFDDLDRFVGRAAARWVGPQIVAPAGEGPVADVYASLQEQGRLVTHSAPQHSPGRELIENHSKILVRQFWHPDAAAPYGWVYVGSHNLTKAAWGSAVEAEGGERLWVGNRELGVLLIQPRHEAGRGAGGGLFSRTPLPFRVPALPADLSGREIGSTWVEQAEEQTEQWDWSTQNWWQQEWNGWSSWSDDEEDGQDWRLAKRNWWWWA